MPAKRSRPKQPHRRRKAFGREWVGGFLSPPFFVTEDSESSYRPELAIWVDANEGLVLGQNLVSPGDEAGALGDLLASTIADPAAGPPGPPDRIRLPHPDLLAEVRAALGDEVPIEVAACPELDDVMQALLETMPASEYDESYLDNGRLSEDLAAEVFEAAQLLYGLAPWKVMSDSQTIRVDIQSMNVEGACLSVIGNLEESLGFLLFPSLDAYDSFVSVAERGLSAEDPRVDMGTGWLSLCFESGRDLPPRMRREAMTHGWPVAGPDAYPHLQRMDRDATPRPLVGRDLRIAGACTTALCMFYARNREQIEANRPEPMSETFTDENDSSVRITFPYLAHHFFAEVESEGSLEDSLPPLPPSSGRKVGRNAPCPCGSGRKYKKCHLRLEQKQKPAAADPARAHSVDRALVLQMSEFAAQRFGPAWFRFHEDFIDAKSVPQLAVPWSVYHFEVEGKPVFQWYVEEHGGNLGRRKRDWLAAQSEAWLSIWEVLEVAGTTITFRDLLSHQQRDVHDVGASQTLVARDVLLARIVENGGKSLLGGCHSRPLPPREAAEVERLARRRLRLKRAVPTDRLRQEKFGRYLIGRWEEAVEDLEQRLSVPPTLHNTDDDPLILTTDHFELRPGSNGDVFERLGNLEGVEKGGAQSDDEEIELVFLEPGNSKHPDWDNTLVGRARLSATELRLETNSVRRADALRKRVEDACGDRICHRAREHTDPLSPMAGGLSAPSSPELTASEEGQMEQMVFDFKKRHYDSWPDQPLPALGGLTAREAVRTADGRVRVDVLLKEMENQEQRANPNGVYDFAEVRRELGLD